MLNSVSQAHNAYNQSLQNSLLTNVTDSTPDSVSSFGSVLSEAVGQAVSTGHDAEVQATQGLSGGGNMTQIVGAISRAQLALQTTTVIRDRVIQAYQDVIKMSI